MGRYYKLTVGGQTWSSQYNNKDDPGAPLVELDINIAPAVQGPPSSCHASATARAEAPQFGRTPASQNSTLKQGHQMGPLGLG
jgi:hypothetical protein